jgi:hypothetical protein
MMVEHRHVIKGYDGRDIARIYLRRRDMCRIAWRCACGVDLCGAFSVNLGVACMLTEKHSRLHRNGSLEWSKDDRDE